MPVSIVTMAGPGQDNFLGLLYQTLVYYSNDPASKGRMIYYWDPDVAEKVQAEMSRASKPGSDKTNKSDQACDYAFLIGFKPGTIRSLFNGKDNAGSGHALKDFDCCAIEVYELGDKDIATLSFKSSPSEMLVRMFSNNVAIMPVDCSKLSSASSGTEFAAQRDYDAMMARLLRHYVNKMSAKAWMKKGRPTELHILIVLTNLDKIEPQTLRKLGLDKIMKLDDRIVGDNLVNRIKDINYYHAGRKARALQKSSNTASLALMAAHMPETLNILNGPELDELNAGACRTNYFLSWTINETSGDVISPRTTRLRYSNGKTYESILYSRHMYIQLVEHMREIANKSPDSDEGIEELTETILRR